MISYLWIWCKTDPTITDMTKEPNNTIVHDKHSTEAKCFACSTNVPSYECFSNDQPLVPHLLPRFPLRLALVDLNLIVMPLWWFCSGASRWTSNSKIIQLDRQKSWTLEIGELDTQNSTIILAHVQWYWGSNHKLHMMAQSRWKSQSSRSWGFHAWSVVICLSSESQNNVDMKCLTKQQLLFLHTAWGPQNSVQFSCLISGWILWFMVDTAN